MFRPARILTAALLVAAAPAFAQTEGPEFGPSDQLAQMPPPPPPGPGGGPGGPRPESRRIERMFEMLDVNHDGKLTFDEISSEYKRMIAASDVDGDGAISVDEFRRRGHMIMSVGAISMFDMLDANGDGKITLEEIQAPSQRWFKRYDANKDGNVDSDELAAQIRPAMRGPRR
jgi:Ca2+-binding EF-hand superfamily protein